MRFTLVSGFLPCVFLLESVQHTLRVPVDLFLGSHFLISPRWAKFLIHKQTAVNFYMIVVPRRNPTTLYILIVVTFLITFHIPTSAFSTPNNINMSINKADLTYVSPPASDASNQINNPVDYPTKLYPEIEPYNKGLLKVGDGHELYFEECGNPDGIPAVFLHGA